MVTPPPMPPEVRAESLRVLIALGAGTPHLAAPEALELGLPRLTERDVAALELAGDDDLVLVNSCLVVEYELRERAYAALERLCAHTAAETGPLDERLRALPLQPFADAATCLYELGWVTPKGGDDRV
jgi:hypothetical protein